MAIQGPQSVYMIRPTEWSDTIIRPRAIAPGEARVRVHAGLISLVGDPGCGIRDSGFGIREARFGMRDSGCGVRDARSGIRDTGFEIGSAGPRGRALPSGPVSRIAYPASRIAPSATPSDPVSR